MGIGSNDPYKWVVKYRCTTCLWRRTKYRTFRTSWEAGIFVDLLLDSKSGYKISVYRLFEW